MASGDGWLVRVRAGARALTSAQLRALAALAREYGNGIIELTRRANLQLRGLQSARIPALRQQLIALGVVDASPRREARPGWLVDPIVALQDTARLSELQRALDQVLAESASLYNLSAKLGVVLDAGSGMLSSVDADVRVVAIGSSARVQIQVGTHAGNTLLGECEHAQAPEVVRTLLGVLGTSPPAGDLPGLRMRDLVATRGLDSLRREVESWVIKAPPVAHPLQPMEALGLQVAGGRAWFGIGVPFGSACEAQWHAIAGLAERHGAAEVRLTPAREVLILGARPEAAELLAAEALQHGFITEPRDPRRQVVACSGAPACGAAHGETRSLAGTLGAELKPLLAAGATLHVSGCEKGCASQAAADLCIVLAPGGARLARNTDIAGTCRAPVEPVATIAQRVRGLMQASEGTHDT